MVNTYQVQPLESFRLGRMKLPITCYFCGHDNAYEATTCRNCVAPMEIARNFQETQVRPVILPTIGADGVGKSVFLGLLLDILSRQRTRTETLTNDAASIVMQKEIMSALARCEFPDRTSHNPTEWRWAHCRVQQRSRKQPLSVFFVDVAGAAIFREIEFPQTFPIITSLFDKASGVFLLLDAGKVQQGEKEEEFFAMELLSYLSDVRLRHRSDGLLERSRALGSATPPVAVILHKADLSPAAMESPQDFVAGQTPGVIRSCNDLLSQYEFFATSAVGATAEFRKPCGSIVDMPLRVEPRGILSPFRWMMRAVGPH